MSDNVLTDIREILALYKNGKVSWLEVGRLLTVAEEEHGMELMKLPFKELGTSRSSITRFVSSYKFLRFNRPDFIKNPKESASLDVIARLPYLRYKMGQVDIPDLEFQKLLDEVLNGEKTGSDLDNLSKKIGVEKSIQSDETFLREEQKLDPKPHSMATLEKSLDVLDFVLTQALENNTRNEIKECLNRRIYNISIKLNNIIDDEHYRLYKEGRVFSV